MKWHIVLVVVVAVAVVVLIGSDLPALLWFAAVQ